jgi:hypothetical protein
LAVTLAPVVADRPVAGLQAYVLPPVAVSVVDEPLQMATLEPPLMVGNAFTVTATVAVFTHPFPSVPVTV